MLHTPGVYWEVFYAIKMAVSSVQKNAQRLPEHHGWAEAIQYCTGAISSCT